ncbi:hypothetical protein HDE_01612 [Halotydeus destructor]|nr:hypothetical protein HDE_01612 [Halotydeus destructor]
MPALLSSSLSLLIAIQLTTVFGQNLDVPPVDHCQEHMKCMLREGQATPDKVQGAPTWLSQCKCDSSCFQYGDCCLDIFGHLEENIRNWSYLYLKYSDLFFTWSGLMKSRCPPSWNNSAVQAQCEDIGLSDQEEILVPEYGHILTIANELDEFKLWHVTSNGTSITYRNIYCAVCNDDYSSLTSWYQMITCIPDDVQNRTCHRAAETRIPKAIADNFVQRSVNGAHYYQRSLMNSCNLAWFTKTSKNSPTQALDTWKKCSLYYAPVSVNVQLRVVSYKNKYCAICNGFSELDLVCPSKAKSQLLSPHKLEQQVVAFDADVISGGKLPLGLGRCQPGFVYDPFVLRCRDILRKQDTLDAEMTNEHEMFNDTPGGAKNDGMKMWTESQDGPMASASHRVKEYLSLITILSMCILNIV